jgi:rod shape-determining protein MreD
MNLTKWIRFIFSAVALVLLQVLVINQLEINRLVYPQIYFLVLLGLPVNLKHWQSYLIAFALGMAVDGFMNTPGLHAFVCTLMVFIRYIYLKNFADTDWLSTNVQPSLQNMELVGYLLYTTLFSVFFHLFYFIFENLSLSHWPEILLKTIYSTSLSILLILLLQFTFSPRVKNE